MPWFVFSEEELMMRLIRGFVPAAVLIVALGQAGRAEAGLMMKLSDATDGASVTIVDNGLGDSNPMTGVIVFMGPVGEFSLGVTTGVSKPFIGNGVLPRMDLNSVDVKSVGSKGDTLTIMLTETNWAPTPTTTLLKQHVGGTMTDSITSATFNAFIDPTNTPFGIGVGTIPGTPQTFASNAYSGTTNLLSGPLGSAYSATMIATLKAGAEFGIASFDFSLSPVPEPSSLTLAGFAILAGLGVAYRQRRRRTA
jgi:hypothetical protein